jgi:hypothetical protein
MSPACSKDLKYNLTRRMPYEAPLFGGASALRFSTMEATKEQTLNIVIAGNDSDHGDWFAAR